MPEITYRHEVPFGHRLMNHEGKCRFPHGHNYIFEISVTGQIDPGTGMVLDFSLLKRAVRQFFEQFDHAFVMYEGDPLVNVFRSMTYNEHSQDGRPIAPIADPIPSKVIVLNQHPTAENLARLCAVHMSKVFRSNVAVSCWEQRDCGAHVFHMAHVQRAVGEDNTVRIVEMW